MKTTQRFLLFCAASFLVQVSMTGAADDEKKEKAKVVNYQVKGAT